MTSDSQLSTDGKSTPALSGLRRSVNLRTRPSLPTHEPETAKDQAERTMSERSIRSWRRSGIPPKGFVSAPPDGKFAWWVLLGACLAGFTAVSLNVVVSVLLDELIVLYDSNAATISWSISICSGAGSVFAPIATAVINYYSCRRSLLIGGTLFTLGLIAASFANTVEVFLGMFLMLAVGNSFCFTPLPVILSQYFRKYYGIAFGCLTAAYASSKLVLTPVFQIISAQYGVRGTLLISGGFMMNIVVGAALFQPARWHQVLIPTFQDKIIPVDEHPKTPSTILVDSPCTKEPTEDAIDNRVADSIKNGDNRKETKERNNLLIVSGGSSNKPSLHHQAKNGSEKEGDDETGETNPEQRPFLTKSHTEVNMADGNPNVSSVRRGSVPAYNLASSLDLFHAVSIEAVCNPPPLVAQTATSGAPSGETEKQDKGCMAWCITGLKGFCGSIDHSLWREAVFQLICVHSIFSIGTMIYGSLYLYPFGVDAGLEPVQSAALVSSRSLGELFGRLLGPVAVTALKLDPRFSFIGLSLTHGIALVVLTYMRDLTSLLAVGGICGILFGAAVGLTMVLIMESVGVKRLASTLGLTAFVYSPFMLALGPILGAIKDYTGTYRSCIIILAAMQFANATLWLCKPFIVRNQRLVKEITA